MNLVGQSSLLVLLLEHITVVVWKTPLCRQGIFYLCSHRIGTLVLLGLLQLRTFRLPKTLGHVLTRNWSWRTWLLPVFLIRRINVVSTADSEGVSANCVSLNNSAVILHFDCLVADQYMSAVGDVELQLSLNGDSMLREVVNLSVLSEHLIFVESVWISRLHMPLWWNFPV
jgi:hypothetical protein